MAAWIGAADRGASRGLSRRASGPDPRISLSGRRAGVWRRRSAEWVGGGLSARTREGSSSSARGHLEETTAGQGGTHLRSRHLEAGRTRSCCRGLPVTSVARTVVDIAAALARRPSPGRATRRASATARPRQRSRPSSPSRPDAGQRRCCGRYSAGTSTSLSAGSSRALSRPASRQRISRCRSTNRPAGGRRVDCRWPEHRLTVELDSYRYHASRYAWEQDRRREREAYARGRRLPPLHVRRRARAARGRCSPSCEAC